MASRKRARPVDPPHDPVSQGRGRPSKYRPKGEQRAIRLTALGFALLEVLREDDSRSDYVEGLVHADAERRPKLAARAKVGA